MLASDKIRAVGLLKLAEGEEPPPAAIEQAKRLPVAVTPEMMRYMLAEEAKRRSGGGGIVDALAVHNPLQAPTPHQRDLANSYAKAAIVGALTGGSIGSVLGHFIFKDPLRYGALGAGTGIIGSVVRHYDQLSDPPGLNPVYTIPAGFRIGGAAGAIGGGLLGHYLGTGAIKGAITGAALGGIGGGAVSTFV